MYSVLRQLLILTFLLLAGMAAMLACQVPYGWLIAPAVIAFALRKKAVFWAYGTARWANFLDLARAGMIGGKGLALGVIEAKVTRVEAVKALFSRLLPRLAVQVCLCAFQRKTPWETVRLPASAVHTAVFSPVGGGKSTGLAIPFQLENDESAVVLDPKGELAKITAHARKRMGHRVVILDPYRCVTQSPDTYNPLADIRPESDTFIDDCQDLAEALVVKTGQEKDPYWNGASEVNIGSTTAAVVHFAGEETRNLQTVRSILANPKLREETIGMMQRCDNPILRRMGDALTHFVDKNRDSVLTTVDQHLRWLDTLAMAESTSSSTFDPALLKKGKMTVYIILPPERMRAGAGWLRMVIGGMLRACVKGGPNRRSKVHFVLDEAASLGHLECLDDAVDKLRAYGVRLQLYYQSLGQLQKCWPEGRDVTLLANTSQVFLATQDLQTCEYVSNRLGEFTQVVTSGGSSTSRSWSESPSQHGGSSTSYSRSKSWNDNWQQAGRKLLKPEEVAALDERWAITFTPGAPPLMTWVPRYYEEPIKTGFSPMKMAGDTLCMFLAVAMCAAMWAALLYCGKL